MITKFKVAVYISFNYLLRSLGKIFKLLIKIMKNAEKASLNCLVTRGEGIDDLFNPLTTDVALL